MDTTQAGELALTPDSAIAATACAVTGFGTIIAQANEIPPLGQWSASALLAAAVVMLWRSLERERLEFMRFRQLSEKRQSDQTERLISAVDRLGRAEARAEVHAEHCDKCDDNK